MIIYNKTWLNNLELQEQAKQMYSSGNISKSEFNSIEEKYPAGFYSPNIFIRAGLFILTLVTTSCAGGLLSLTLGSIDNLITSPGYWAFLGIISYISLEMVVKTMHHFRSGVDDALMWTAVSLFIAAYFGFTDNTSSKISFEAHFSGFAFLLACYFTLRFADMLMAFLSFLSLVAFIFFNRQVFGAYSTAILPFLMILTSAGIYFLALYWNKFRHYKNCLLVIQVASLLMAYAAGNYFVVRELGSMISDPAPAEGQGIPLGWFFWIWTIALPFLYIALGIRRKEIVLLRSGLILIAAAAFTFRNYYHLIPLEGALCIAGAALLTISYLIIRYLKTPKYGFTYEETDQDHLMDKIKVESLIVGETFSSSQPAPEGNRMGGGSFGGGGAGADF